MSLVRKPLFLLFQSVKAGKITWFSEGNFITEELTNRASTSVRLPYNTSTSFLLARLSKDLYSLPEV